MHPSSASILARSLMKVHGLGGWSFRFDHARRRFGSCCFSRKQITLSKPLVLLNPEEQVRDTILHEIAHALTPRTGHGPEWKAMCVRIGARPVRCYGEEEVVSPARRPAPWQMGCESCEWWTLRHRRSRRRYICKTCRAPVAWKPSPHHHTILKTRSARI